MVNKGIKFSLLEALQKHGEKFTVIECGNGAAVTNTILSVPGASQMLEESFQPYSREAQVAMIGEYKRSVSKEWILQAFDKFNQFDYPSLLITQFQLQGDDPSVLTHGWIGIRTKTSTAIYHISYIPTNDVALKYDTNYTYQNNPICKATYVREQQFDFIASAAIEIMYKHTVDINYELDSLFIDGIFNGKGNLDMINTIKILGQSSYNDTMVVIRPDSTWCRMEDLMRESTGLILMRGSFNPIHAGHIAMIASAKEHYPTYQPVCLISIHNCRKAPVEPEDAINRAEGILKLGLPVVFSSLPLFDDSTKTIRNRWKHPIIYPAGMDTINRFIDDVIKSQSNQPSWSPEFKNLTEDEITEYRFNHCKSDFEIWVNTKFLVFERKGNEPHKHIALFDKLIEYEKTYNDTGISSTKIRNGEWK